MRSAQPLSMDSKGRISIPAKHRDVLSRLVIVPNPMPEEPCLLVYPIDIWEKIEADFVARPKTKQNRRIMRVFIGEAEDYTLDSNGRVLIKPSFREFADLDKKVILVGQGNKLEIWNETAWANIRSDIEDEQEREAFVNELESVPY